MLPWRLVRAEDASGCFSESNSIFEVAALRPSCFLFPQTVRGTVWLSQIDAQRRSANGTDVSGQPWLVSLQSEARVTEKVNFLLN